MTRKPPAAVPATASQSDSPAVPDTVGYGKPPTATRFRKGQSGNPKGRPKGSWSAKQLFRQALDHPVTITENGVARRVKQADLIFRSLLAKALKGDSRSIALIINLMEQWGFKEQPFDTFKIERVIVDTRKKTNRQET